MDIGKNIKALRKAHALSQKDLAHILNTSQQHISHLENNERHLDIIELKCLADYFNITCDFLISENFSIYTTDSDSMKLFNTYASLTDSDQELIKKLILRLASP